MKFFFSPEVRLSLLIFGSLTGFALLSWMFQERSGLLLLTGAFFSIAVAGAFTGWQASRNAAQKRYSSRQRFDHAQKHAERLLKKREALAEEFLTACSELFDHVELHEIGEAVLRIALKNLNADQVSVMLLDEKKNHLRILVSHGLSEQLCSQVSLKMGERVAGLSAFERKEFLLNGDLGNYPLFRDFETNPLVRSAIICPILYKDDVLGVLNLTRTIQSSSDFSQWDLKAAKMLARQVGLAFHHVTMCESLRVRADDLKKLYQQLKESRLELIEFEKQRDELLSRRAS